eukprot:CAMPEP_0172197688 /NCGR_PEP_ID=MMETSP1050-20130122/27622_1 /TAXON_ID=233186 /ORGANISM="Cryptomonas curvata, Strain CCAP979/52" /LENGTH=169 /DNA_ID=CAMNT_0012874329 /DNA_START=68 /DNA_END=574 /DNA_ORIENTATION=+
MNSNHRGEDGDNSETESPDDKQNANGRGQTAPPGHCGLPNLGNTCYLNSALQAVLHTPAVARYFIDCAAFLPPENPPPGASRTKQAQRRLIYSLRGVMRQVWCAGVRTASPGDFVKDVMELSPDFRGYGQQDAQEFLSRLLRILHDELAPQSSLVMHMPFSHIETHSLR